MGGEGRAEVRREKARLEVVVCLMILDWLVPQLDKFPSVLQQLKSILSSQSVSQSQSAVQTPPDTERASAWPGLALLASRRYLGQFDYYYYFRNRIPHLTYHLPPRRLSNLEARTSTTSCPVFPRLVLLTGALLLARKTVKNSPAAPASLVQHHLSCSSRAGWSSPQLSCAPSLCAEVWPATKDIWENSTRWLWTLGRVSNARSQRHL